MMKAFLIVLMIILSISMSVHAEMLHRVDEEYPPFLFLKDEVPSGLTVEIFAAILQRVPDMKADYKIYPWKRALKVVSEKPNAFVFMTRTEKREPEYKWVGPICRRTNSIFKLRRRTDLQVSTLKDIISYSVGVVRGYLTQEILLNAGMKEAHGHLELVTRGHQNIKKLFANRIDFVAENDFVFNYLVKDEGFQFREVELVLSLDEQPPRFLSFAFNKQTDDLIIRQLQQALEVIRREGVYDAILKKYTE